jgi:ABC-2 type transport system ATP-binding protein
VAESSGGTHEDGDGVTERPAIRTTNLTRAFGQVHAVDDLSLDVPPGIIFGFLGPNGSGKTTTIRLLLGLLEPTSGSAEVLGYDTRTQGEQIRGRAGALLEHPGIYERLSARDNLEFYGRVWRMPAAERADRIRTLLTDFGLWDRRDQDAGSWSRGMKQKLAVARALLHRPPLVFLDEPTSGLDPIAAASLTSDLLDLAQREGTTVFLTTHNLTEAEKVCSLVGVIREGRLVAIGTPDELRARAGGQHVDITARGVTPPVLALLESQPQVESVAAQDGHLRLVLCNEARMAPLVRLMVEAGVDVEEVRKGSASLEDAFLELMGEPS